VATWVFPAVSAAVSAAFAALVLIRYVKSRKTHQLLWTLGLFGFTGAAAAQVVYALSGAWLRNLNDVGLAPGVMSAPWR